MLVYYVQIYNISSTVAASCISSSIAHTSSSICSTQMVLRTCVHCRDSSWNAGESRCVCGVNKCLQRAASSARTAGSTDTYHFSYVEQYGIQKLCLNINHTHILPRTQFVHASNSFWGSLRISEFHKILKRPGKRSWACRNQRNDQEPICM